MLSLFVLCTLFSLISSLALPQAHEKVVNSKWKKVNLLQSISDERVSLTIALKQRNVAKLEKLVSIVSDPQSSQYGKYFSIDEIAKLVAPEESVVNKVKNWAEQFALSTSTVITRDFITVESTVSKIEKFFNIKMNQYQHLKSGRKMFRSVNTVHLSSDIAPHIDLITGLTDFFDYNHERKMRFNRKINAQSTNAPQFSVIRGSERDLIVPVKIFCPDGVPANINIPCNISNPILITVSLFDGFNTKNHQIPYDNNHCQFSQQEGITICKDIFAVAPYQRVNVSARVTYNKTLPSPPSFYPSIYTPSPWITPQYLSNLYGVPKGYRQPNNNTLYLQNSQSVVAFEEQYISTDDLMEFFDAMGLPRQLPIIKGQNDPSNPGGESTLDIQWVMGIGAGVRTTFWSVTGPGPAKPPGQGAYILDWALQISNTANAPYVTSISYGDTESGYYWKFGSYDYLKRMDIELAKMALRGMTVVAGSGDAGSSNVGEEGNDISNTDPTCTPLRAFYPSNSQYVLGVSSTFPSIYSKPICSQQYAGKLPVTCSELGEVAVDVGQGTHWTTGGGFSNVTMRPDWQNNHVSAYLAKLMSQNLLPPKQFWNQNGRGYPDISTLGHNFIVYWGGALTPIGGTSSSGPAIAGLIALINGMLLERGLPTVGLMHRALYGLEWNRPGWYFNDVIVGTNFNGDLQFDPQSPYATFCPYGYTAEIGWDAVTGLGTPNFNRLSHYFLSLRAGESHKDHTLDL